MAITWGATVGPSSSGQSTRIGLELTRSGSTVTRRTYLWSAGPVSDDITLNFSGTGSGSAAYGWYSTGQVLARTDSYSIRQGQTLTFGASVSGLYNGQAPSVSASITWPASVPSAVGKPTLSNIKTVSLKASWSAPASNGASITNYQIQVAYDSGFTNVLGSPTINATSRTMDSLPPNTTLYFRVRAYNSAGWGSYGSASSAKTLALSPVAPSAVVGTRVSDSSITVTWINNSGSSAPYSSITIQRSTDGGAFTTVATASASATSWSDTGTSANHIYQYQVQATGPGGTSSFTQSGLVYTTPAAPSTVVGAKDGSNISLTWVNNQVDSSEQTTHEIYEGSTLIDTVAATVSTYTVVAPDSSVSHTYKVRTVTAGLYSDFATSNTVQLLTNPLAPTNLTPRTGYQPLNTNVTVRWTHNPGDGTSQTGYQLRYRLSSSASWTELSKVTSASSQGVLTAAQVGGSTPTTVQWQVRTWAQDTTKAGEWSATATFTTVARPVVTITAPDAGSTANSDSVLLQATANKSGSLTWTITVTQTLAGATTSTTLSVVSASPLSRVLTGLRNGASVTVSVVATAEVVSLSTSVSFTVAYAAPVSPKVDGVWDPDNGSATLTVSNEDPYTVTLRNDALNPSFEGVDGADVYVTNLATNPRFQKTSGTVEVRRNLFTNPNAGPNKTGYNSWEGSNNERTLDSVSSDVSKSGYAIRATWITAGTPNSGDAGFFLTDLGLVAGKTYTAVAKLRASSGVNISSPRLWDTTLGTVASVAYGITSNTPTENQVALSYCTFVCPEGTLDEFRQTYAISNKVVGSWVELFEVDVYEGAYQPEREWFSGSYSPDPDLTPSWTGTENASASVLKGAVPVNTYSDTTKIVTYRSSFGAAMYPTSSTTNDNGISLAGSASTPAGQGVTFTSGKWYGVSAVVTVLETQTGSLSKYARSLRFVKMGNSDSTATIVASNQPPNEPGTYPVSIITQAPSDIKYMILQGFNGARYGNAPVYIDNLLIVEGDSEAEVQAMLDHGYFDGEDQGDYPPEFHPAYTSGSLPSASTMSLLRVAGSTVGEPAYQSDQWSVHGDHSLWVPGEEWGFDTPVGWSIGGPNFQITAREDQVLRIYRNGKPGSYEQVDVAAGETYSTLVASSGGFVELYPGWWDAVLGGNSPVFFAGDDGLFDYDGHHLVTSWEGAEFISASLAVDNSVGVTVTGNVIQRYDPFTDSWVDVATVGVDTSVTDYIPPLLPELLYRGLSVASTGVTSTGSVETLVTEVGENCAPSIFLNWGSGWVESVGLTSEVDVSEAPNLLYSEQFVPAGDVTPMVLQGEEYQTVSSVSGELSPMFLDHSGILQVLNRWRAVAKVPGVKVLRTVAGSVLFGVTSGWSFKFDKSTGVWTVGFSHEEVQE